MKTFVTLLALLGVLLAGCQPQTRVNAVWQQPGYAGRVFKKIAVVALAGEKESRRIYENHVIARIAEHGVPGLAGNDLFAEMPTPEQKAEVKKRFEELGVDAAMALRIVRRETRETTVGPLSDHDRYSYDFYGTYGTFYEPVHREASVEVEKVIVIEAMLFDLKVEGAIAQVEVTVEDPRSIKDVRESSSLIVEALANAGLFGGR
jgi:hypothetical protein